MSALAELETLPAVQRQALLERAWTPTEATRLLHLRPEVLARCATDGLYWLRWVKTRDEADPREPVKAFPLHKAHVPAIWRWLETKQRAVIAKSRQMQASWIASAYMVWTARFTPHQHVVYQTQNWDDALKMVAMPGSAKDGGFLGRCQFIERYLPAWMRQPLQESEGRLIYPNGSMIEALPGGADKIRGKTPSLVVLDEMAFLNEAKATYTAIAPVIQHATKFIAISTPNGGPGNFFYHLFHGLPMEAA